MYPETPPQMSVDPNSVMRTSPQRLESFKERNGKGERRVERGRVGGRAAAKIAAVEAREAGARGEKEQKYKKELVER